MPAITYYVEPETKYLVKPIFLGHRHDYKFIIDEHGILSAVCQVDYCQHRMTAAEIIEVCNNHSNKDDR
jgi:hypothetical protein